MTHLFSFPEQSALAASLVKNGAYTHGDWEWRHFPDGESYVRVLSDVKSKNVAILCSLNNPDEKTLPLLFLARTLKELGAEKVTLIAPYLGYMRQDKRFHAGEAVNSNIYASVLSGFIDALITIDPHLHRHARLEEIYSCDCSVLSATPLMAQWIAQNVHNPLIVGPDVESEQWVKAVAEQAHAPYIVLSKTRRGDNDVEISVPDIEKHKDKTPVLIDDIISTAGTMIKTIELLHQQGCAKILCLATHGVFANDAYERLLKAGAAKIVTANTIPHTSNGMDVTSLLLKE